MVGRPGRLDVFVSLSDGSVLSDDSGLVGVVVVLGVSDGFDGVVVTSLTSLPSAATLSNFSAGLPLR